MSQPQKLPVHIIAILESDDVQSFSFICKKKVRSFGDERMNFLHLAAKYSPGVEIAKYCVHSLKIKPSVKTGRSKSTPLHYAVARGNFDLVSFLLEQRTTPIDAARRSGRTPLLTAVKHNYPELALTLLNHGASINAVDRKRWNVAHWAARNGNYALFQVLVHKGAKFCEETAMHESCLHLSAWSGNLELVQFLVNKLPFPRQTSRGNFFMYMKGNWSVLDWVLRNTQWANMHKLTLLLQIDAPMELIRMHCASELNTISFIVYDRSDLILFQIRQGVRVLECLRHYAPTLRSNCASLYRYLVRFEAVAPLLYTVSHAASGCLIRRMPSPLFKELLEYLKVQ